MVHPNGGTSTPGDHSSEGKFDGKSEGKYDGSRKDYIAHTTPTMVVDNTSKVQSLPFIVTNTLSIHRSNLPSIQ